MIQQKLVKGRRRKGGNIKIIGHPVKNTIYASSHYSP